VVDGYNVAHAAPYLWPGDRDDLESIRRALAEVLAAWVHRHGGSVTLVFDGALGATRRLTRSPGVEVVFSRPPDKADDLIKRELQLAHGSRRVRLVSSDRELQRWARRHRVRATGAVEFLDELETPPRPAQPLKVPRELDPNLALAAAEVEEWARLFAEAAAKKRGHRGV
jgi:predicted RNA-binding protein with PIN domain